MDKIVITLLAIAITFLAATMLVVGLSIMINGDELVPLLERLIDAIAK